MQYEKMSNSLIMDSIFARSDVPEDVIYTLGTYHKYWLDREHGVRNPAFDRYSSNILDLKRGKKAAIEYFYNILEKIIPDDENLMICVVPSSEPGANGAGIKKLCRRLADKRKLIDGTDVLIRSKRIKKLASGGNRSEFVHHDSIEVGWENVRNIVRSMQYFLGEELIVDMVRDFRDYGIVFRNRFVRDKRLKKSPINKDVKVILIDDVATSGNSLRACRDILKKRDVGEVYMIALGRTAKEKIMHENCYSLEKKSSLSTLS